MKDLIPAALRSNRLYDGRVYTRKDLLDHLILTEGFVSKQLVKRKTGSAYRLTSPYGKRLTFSAKAELAYIDKLLSKVKQGASIEMEHEKTIEAIKSPKIKTETVAALIAADHIAEDKNYYEKTDKFKLAKGGKVDRSGNYIGDGSIHSTYFVYDFPEFPQIISSVSKSDTTESVYVNYINKDNGDKITVRFSDHENNATKFGDQLDGKNATKYEILFRIGLKKREFVPNKNLNIHFQMVAKKNLGLYEIAPITIQEMYSLGAGANLSEYKGKLAKDSNYLILGDVVSESIQMRRNHFGESVQIGRYIYKDINDEKLEKGGKIQDLSQGTILDGPSHKQGGIDIQVNEKTVAEAEGGEIVVNKNSSKLFCEEISEINQAGGGKKLDCDKPCDTCNHTKMALGDFIPNPNDNEIEALTYVVNKHFYPIAATITEMPIGFKGYNNERVFKVKFIGDVKAEELFIYFETFMKHWYKTANGVELIDMDYLDFSYSGADDVWYLIIPKKIDLRHFLQNFYKVKPIDNSDLFKDGGEIKNDAENEIIIKDFRPQYNHYIKVVKGQAYYAGYPFHTLKKESKGYFGSDYIYSILSGTQNFILGEIALGENELQQLMDANKRLVIINHLQDGGEIKNNMEIKKNIRTYNIGDEVIYKDAFGDYTLKSKIKSILYPNTQAGQPLAEYQLEDGGAYTYDELKPVMAKGDIIDGGDLYSGSNASKQMKKELTEKFPGIKFSVRYQSYSGGNSVNASWNFGPTTDQVDAVIDKYQYGRFDGMTDSYEYNKDETKLVTPDGTVKNFGGVKYVSSSRDTVINDGKTGNQQWENETAIELLIAKDLAKLNGVEWIGAYTPIPNLGRDNAKDHAYRILRKNAFDTDNVISYDGLVETGANYSQIEEKYKIKYNGNKVTTNLDAEKRIADDAEWERTRPEREAKEKADKEAYELKEYKNKQLLAQLNIKQYDMLNDDEVSNRMENVMWPGSKMSTLSEYKESLKQDIAEKLNTTRATVIKQVIIASDKDFNTLSNNLMEYLPYVWKEIGGTGIPDNVLIENGLNPETTNISGLSSDLIKKLLPYTFSIGTLVFNEDTKESFVADCQGYNYTRYVGLPMDKAEVEKMLLQIKVDNISKFEKIVAEIPEKDFEEMKLNSGVPEFQIQGPVNLNKPTNWNQLPTAWKVVKNLPAIAFDNSPYDKNLIKIVEPFLGSDQFRAVLSGVKFGEDGITATDAQKFIHLPYPNKDFSGIYNVQPKAKFFDGELKGDLIQGTYPNYPAILPNENIDVYKISVLKLKTFVNAISAGKYSNQTTHRVLLNGSKDSDGKITTHAFNGEFLMLILNTCLKLGKETVYFGASTSNKAVIIAFDAETAKSPQSKLGKETIMLLMPIFDYENDTFQNGMIAAAFDGDFDKEFKIAYSLVDDNIYNFDGSIASFNFSLTKATDTDLTTQQEKIVNAYKTKNNAIPILDGVLVKENKLYVTDLENTAIINNVNKPNDVYYYINSAMVVYNAAENQSDEFPKAPQTDEFKSLGSINRLELLFNIEKCNLCVGNDDLRPPMKGVHFVKEKDSNQLVIEATNAHVLFRNEIKNHSIENAIDAIVPATKKLKVFLENTFDENVEISISGVNIMFKTSTATVISRLIDAKYPNVQAVIPRLYEKEFTLDITNLKNCIKSLKKEEKKDDYHLAFNKIANGIMKVDLMLHEYTSGYGQKSETKFIRELCQVKATEITEQKQGKEFVFLGMPTMVNNEDVYPFGIKLDVLETFIKITESNKLVINYISHNKALVLTDSEFKQVAQPVNLPTPAPKAPKQKDVIEQIAEKQEVAHKKEKSKQAVKKVANDDTKAKKIKIAKAKAAAQQQRIRILSMANNKLDDGGKINKPLRSIKVTYSDGTVIETNMAAHLTDKEMLDYFRVGKSVNIGDGTKDKMATITKAEIIN